MPRLQVKEVRGGFRASFGQYSIKIRFPKRAGSGLAIPIPISADISVGREHQANFFGTKTSEVAHLYTLDPARDVPIPIAEPAKEVLLASVEMAMKARGITNILVSSSPLTEDFLQKRGYTGGIEKDITKKGPKMLLKGPRRLLQARLKPRPARKVPAKPKPARPKPRPRRTRRR